ncbi:MAG TPA: hypothetical protein VD905_07460 [Flavobacteriales bacterium]|nr:hypothetical protein [Flavobacteriales bacterium]
MHKLSIGLCLAMLFLVSSCGEKKQAEKEKELPEAEEKIVMRKATKMPMVKKLDGLKRTGFVPTLEHKLDLKKNTVYCASLLFAWDGIRKVIENPINIPASYKDLSMLNASTSYKQVLKPDEYKIETIVRGDTIRVKAEFSKLLPFEQPFNDYQDYLTFNTEKVQSFGLGPHDYDLMRMVDILYYKSDDDFIVELKTTNRNHSLILYKSHGTPGTTFANLHKEITKKIAIGTKEKANQSLAWKFSINAEDELIIPKISFNLEHNYKQIEHAKFTAGGFPFVVIKACQRNAFVLNEYGAEIETEATMETAAAEAPEEENKPKPKKMWFDSSFLLVLQKQEAANPYFALWIANTELLEKEKNN